jgi:p-aminobenzoyl-glutamate transporter AbgT
MVGGTLFVTVVGFEVVGEIAVRIGVYDGEMMENLQIQRNAQTITDCEEAVVAIGVVAVVVVVRVRQPPL